MWNLWPRMVSNTGPSAVASPASLSVTASSSPINSYTTSCGVLGGTATSFLWERVSGSTSMTINTPNSSSTYFRSIVAPEATVSAVFRCKVTLSTGEVIYSNNVSVSLTRNPL